MNPSLHIHILQQLWQDVCKEIAVNSPSQACWKKVGSHKSVSFNFCPHIWRKLSLVPGVQGSMRIFVCPFMVITKIDYSVSGKFFLIGTSCEDGSAGLSAQNNLL
jgi:hypothetical protein